MAKKIYLSLIAICIFVLGCCITASASTLSTLDKFLQDQQFYEVMGKYSAPTGVNDAGTENINMSAGALMYNATDLTLPGKGGMDFALSRDFNGAQQYVNDRMVFYSLAPTISVNTQTASSCVVFRYYEENDTTTPIYIAFSSVKEMLEKENGNNYLLTASNYVDAEETFEISWNNTALIAEYSISSDENGSGVTLEDTYIPADNLPEGTTVKLVRDMTRTYDVLNISSAYVHELYGSAYYDKDTIGAGWSLLLPSLSNIQTTKTDSYSNGSYYDVTGSFFDPYEGHNVNLKFSITYLNSGEIKVQANSFEIFSYKYIEKTTGSDSAEEVDSGKYEINVTREYSVEESDYRLIITITRYDGMVFTFAGKYGSFRYYNLIKMTDKFNNEIAFDTVNKTVTDTYQRKIVYGNTGITVNSQPVVNYSVETINNNAVDPNNYFDEDDTEILNVQKPIDETNISTVQYKTTRELNTVNTGVSSYLPFKQVATYLRYQINDIVLQSGGRINYTYQKQESPVVNQKYVSETKNRLVSRNEYIGETLQSQKNYAYDCADVENRKVTVTVPGTTYTEIYTFDDYGRKIKEIFKNTETGNKYYKSTEYEYMFTGEGNSLPTKTTTKLKETETSSSSIDTVMKYTYNGKQQLLTATRDGELVEYNTYYSYYSLPASQMKKYGDSLWKGVYNEQTAQKYIRRVYSAEASSGTGSISTGYELSDTSRDSKGDIVISESNGVKQNISYNYTTYTEENPTANAVTVTTSISGVSNQADSSGTLLDGTQTLTTTAVYDYLGRQISTTNAANETVTNIYDGKNRVIRTTNPDDTFKTVSYDDINNVVIATNEDNVKEKYVYDGLGREVEAYYLTDAENNTWTKVSQNEYDNKGRLSVKKVFNDDGTEKSRVTYTYYGDNTPKSETVTQGDAVLSKKEYRKSFDTTSGEMTDISRVYRTASDYAETKSVTDKLGRPLRNEIIDGTKTYTQTFTTDLQGNVLTTRDPRANDEELSGYTEQYTYDAIDRVLTATNASNYSTTNTYNSSTGVLTSQRDYRGYITNYTYNTAGQVITVQNPHSYTYNYYDKRGNLVKKDVGYSATDITQTERYVYNSKGQLVASILTPDDTTTEVTRYEYSPAGLVVKMITGMTSLEETVNPEIHSVTTYEYDDMGRLVKETDPLGKIVTYDTNVLGELESSVDKNGNSTTYTYDGLSRVLTKSAPGEYDSATENISYTYDMQGNITRRLDNWSNVVYTYDNIGNLVSEEKSTNTTTYTYNANGDITSSVMTSYGDVMRNTTYTYDGLNRISTIGFLNGNTVTYGYDANSNVTEKLVKTGSTVCSRTTYGYNGLNLLTSKYNYAGTTQKEYYTMSYDAAGNITQVYRSDGTPATYTYYTYDKAGKLTSERCGTEQQTNYTYDVSGNRTGLTVTDLLANTVTKSVSYEYNKANRLVSQTDTENGRQNMTYYVYDNNGNMTLKTHAQIAPASGENNHIISLDLPEDYSRYTYDGFNRLKTFTSGDTFIVYRYDGNNLRTEKIINGEYIGYIYEGDRLAFEYIGEDEYAYNYGYDLVDCTLNGTETKYYMTDHHSNVSKIHDASYNVVNNYNYDAFGNEHDITESCYNPFNYCGEYVDEETGFVYLRNRYYDPSIGRFITEDPYWNTSNMIYDSVNDVNDDIVEEIRKQQLLEKKVREIYSRPGGSDLEEINEAKKYITFKLDGEQKKQINDEIKNTKLPSVNAIKQSGNLYVYCLNNPVRNIDPKGKSVIAIGGVVGLKFGTLILTTAITVGATIAAGINYFKEHTKNKSKSNWDKHTKKRPGDKSKAQEKPGWVDRSNKNSKKK